MMSGASFECRGKSRNSQQFVLVCFLINGSSAQLLVINSWTRVRQNKLLIEPKGQPGILTLASFQTY